MKWQSLKILCSLFVCIYLFTDRSQNGNHQPTIDNNQIGFSRGLSESQRRALLVHKKGMKSKELVEVDLESVLVLLESSLMRICLGCTEFFGCFGWFWAILGVKMGLRQIFFDWNRQSSSSSIWNPVGIIWNSTQPNRPRFFSDFWVFWVVLGDFRGEDGD